MRATEKGFVLMEVIPAMFLMMLVLVAASRLLWVAGQGRLAAARQESAAEAMEQSLLLREGDSEAVMLLWEPRPGDWEARFFPDESWLPEIRPGAGAHSFACKHERIGVAPGQDLWMIHRL